MIIVRRMDQASTMKIRTGFGFVSRVIVRLLALVMHLTASMTMRMASLPSP